MSKRQTITILVVAVALSAPLMIPLGAQQRARVANDNRDEMTAALKQMRETSQQLFKVRTAEYRAEKIGAQKLFASQQRLFDIELQLAKTADQRKQVRAKQLSLSKEIEKLVEARYRTGAGDQGDVLETRLLRMSIELSILKQKNGK